MSRKKKQLTDVHIHSVAFGTSALHHRSYNRVKSNIKIKMMLKTLAEYHGILDKRDTIDTAYVEYLSKTLEQSKSVSRGVVFGLDGVYDEKGWLDRDRTIFLINNDYVCESLKPYPNLYYAASINPARRDALDELDRVYDQGAVLVKVLPNTQHFNPVDAKYIPFYKKLEKLNLPLLGHTGYEFALPGSNQKLGALSLYETALEQGVNFIGAHACASGLAIFETQIETMADYFARYPNFYIDLSALSLRTRFNVIQHLQNLTEFKSRMFFGTDFPLPVTTKSAGRQLGPVEKSRIDKIENYFDRYIAFLDKFGILPEKDPFDLFANTS
ncbi:MAG: amidohydrolase family protein [Leptospirales bacterium]